MSEASFIPQINFFPYIIKPGRYAGVERGIVPPAGEGDRRLLLVYPAEYELSTGDFDFQQLYFLFNAVPGLSVERSVLFAADAREQLKQLGRPPFSLESQTPWTAFDRILFYVPDSLAAAQIPFILRELRETESTVPPTATVSVGRLVPSFLAGVTDDHFGAASFSALIEQVSRKLDVNPADSSEQFFARGETQQLVPTVGTPFDQMKIPLFAGPLVAPHPGGARTARAVARDVLLGIKATGFETISFLSPPAACSDAIPEVFEHLSQRANLARHSFCFPAITPEAFLSSWERLRPLFLKPKLPLLFPGGERVDDVPAHPLTQAGIHALGLGWKTIEINYYFADWEDYRTGLSSLVAIAGAINEKARGYEGKRSVRVRWVPAEDLAWRGPYQCDQRIRDALLAIHYGVLTRLPGDALAGSFSPGDELARQLFARLGTNAGPLLAQLPPRPFDPQAGERVDILEAFLQAAVENDMQLPEFGAPIDLALSPFLQPGQSQPGDTRTNEPEDLPTVADVFGRRRRKAAFTRRLTKMPLRRLRVCYAKERSARFYSHLDLTRAFERTIRRSRIPVAYSAGFHPRAKISFGPPLPLGATSRAEYLDIVLDQDYEQRHSDALRRNAPSGLTIVDTLALPEKVSSLFERINLIVYRVSLPADLELPAESLSRFLAESSFEIERVTEQKTTRKDIRPFVQTLRLTTEDHTPCLEMELLVTSQGTVRPAEIVAALAGEFDHRRLVFERIGVYIQQGNKRQTPLDLR